MTDFELKWSDKSIKEYVKNSVTGGTAGKFTMILYIVCFAVVPIAAVIVYFVTNQYLALIFGGCALLFGLGTALALHFTLKSLTEKLSEACKEQQNLICSVSDNNIVIVKNNTPVNVIDWNNVTELKSGKTALFLTTNNNLIIILEKDAVISGELRETEELFALKSALIKK